MIESTLLGSIYHRHTKSTCMSSEESASISSSHILCQQIDVDVQQNVLDLLFCRISVTCRDFMGDFHLRESPAVARMWAEYDKKNSDVVSFNDYITGVGLIISKGTPVMKLQFLFQVIDWDGDGLVTRDELMQILKVHILVEGTVL